MKFDDIVAARERIAGQIKLTPCERSATLSALTGADVFLKFENQQFTASFKERGALNALLQIPAEQLSKGVIAMSAGNHAQAVAYHGGRLNVPVTIVMPRSTPNAKVEQTKVFGADVVLHGNQFDATLAYTQSLAAERGLTLIHPYDDPAVIAGQGTLGLELADQVQNMDDVIVPVGGGGLISGVAVALKHVQPGIRIVGVQMESFPAAHNMFHGLKEDQRLPKGTVAEGIAVKSPGKNTGALIKRYVDDMVLVSEEQVEGAVFTLLEIEKTVTEGAGAAALAALTAYPDRFKDRRVVLLLTGGNIDMMMLSSVLQRGLVRSRRLVKLSVEIADTPGALGELTNLLGQLDSNIVDIVHQRAFAGSSVRATRVDLVLQMRGEEQVDQVVAAIVDAGYEVIR